MRFHLTLTQKGLILVAVPLIFQVAFLVVLSSLKNQIDYDDALAIKGKAVLASIYKLHGLLVDGETGIRGYLLTNDPSFREPFDTAKREIREQGSSLQNLVSDNEKEYAIASSLNALAKQKLALLDEMNFLIEQGALEEAIQIDLYQRGSGKAIMDEFRTKMRALLKEEEQLSQLRQNKGSNLRQSLKAFLYIGLIADILIALFLLVFFVKSITSRLQIMMDNTQRLARDEPLNPPLKQIDEISQLDSVFHEMADELQASAAKQKAIIESMLVGVIIADPKGHIESANQAVEFMFGYSREELVGEPILQLFPVLPGQDPESFIAGLRMKAEGHIYELKARRHDGALFPLELSMTEIETERGPRLLANVRDISERREVDRMKKEFVSIVSHELRTPLTSIRGSLTLLTSGAVGTMPDEALEMLAIAERNAVRLIALINDILDLERLESGKLDMHFAPVPLSSIISSATEAVAALAATQKVTIVQPESAAIVIADQERLIQVIVNLLSNAIKFSPEESTVTIEISETPGWTEVSVTDAGRGIPTSSKEAIFERFHQVEAGDARDKGGSGLGLAICKTIIEKHSGTIGVSSKEGEGSKFWFRIPTAYSAVDWLDQLNLDRSASVLLVDDDLELLAVMQQELTKDGVNVTVASTVKDAIRQANLHTPQLMVLDIGLADGEGFEVVETFKNNPYLKDISMLVYTGRNLTSDECARLHLGPTYFLTKAKATDKEFRSLVLGLLQHALKGQADADESTNH
jgi:PAS domain S-box-containing protein